MKEGAERLLEPRLVYGHRETEAFRPLKACTCELTAMGGSTTRPMPTQSDKDPEWPVVNGRQAGPSLGSVWRQITIGLGRVDLTYDLWIA